MEQAFNDAIAVIEAGIAELREEIERLKAEGGMTAEAEARVLAKLNAVAASVPAPVEVPEPPVEG